MRILDEYGQEISIEDVDLDKGYLKEEEIFIETRPELKHYRVLRFNFSDGTFYIPTNEKDSHIKIIDATTGKFEYIPDEGDTRKVKGMSIGLIIDQEAEEIYETIQRYILYTEEELVQRTLPERMASAEETIEETGLTIEDLILLMAEVLGGAEEEEIPEEEPEPEEESEPTPEEVPTEDSSLEEPIE